MIILEGPDNAGKSTLAKELQRRFKWPYRPAGGPPKSPEEIRGRQAAIEAILTARQFAIIDRAPVISDTIYGVVLKRPVLNFDQTDLDRFLKLGPCIIYCRPPNRILMQVAQGHVVKDHETVEHVEAVKRNAKECMDAYDELMERVPNKMYDWTGKYIDTTMDELCDYIVRGEWVS